MNVERKARVLSAKGVRARCESFAGGARGFAKQNQVFEHTGLPLCRPGVSIKQILIELNRNQGV